MNDSENRSHKTSAKLVFVINSLGGGGAERLLQTISTDFVNRGHSVLILTLEDPQIAYRFPQQVKIRPLWTRFLNRGAGKILCLPLIALELRIRLRKARPDGCMAFMYRSNFAAVLARILGFRGRLILSEHIDIDLCYPGHSSRDKIMRGLTRMLYPLADNVLAVSEGVRDSLVSLGLKPDKVTVLHNVIDQSRLRLESKNDRRHHCIRSNTPPIFVNIGRLCAQKNQVLLLQAVRLLRDRGHFVEVQLIGEGPDLENLRQTARELQIEESVHFLGWQENPYSFMAQAHAFVLSSNFEGFGIVLVEAMACGLPVISTDCPSGPAEILGNGAFGDLVPVGDAAALASCMEKIVLDNDYRNAQKEKGLTRAKDFGILQTGSKYLSLILGSDLDI